METPQPSPEIATVAGQKGRQYVYNGQFPTPPSENSFKRNRAVKRRKRSHFNLVFVIFTVSLLIVFYIWNKITVDRLVVEMNDLQNQYQKITNSSEILRAEINKKSSLERISKLAIEQLGLMHPKEQPVWLAINQENPE